MQWVMFGSSGLVKRPSPGGPLAHYQKCTGYLSFQTKCLANMYHAADEMMKGDNVHRCQYKCVAFFRCILQNNMVLYAGDLVIA